MTLADLLKKIRDAEYLDDDTKRKWFGYIPHMDISDLNKLAGLINWAEEQIAVLSHLQDEMLSKMIKIFAKMNLHAANFSTETVNEFKKSVLRKDMRESRQTIDVNLNN